MGKVMYIVRSFELYRDLSARFKNFTEARYDHTEPSQPKFEFLRQRTGGVPSSPSAIRIWTKDFGNLRALAHGNDSRRKQKTAEECREGACSVDVEALAKARRAAFSSGYVRVTCINYANMTKQ